MFALTTTYAYKQAREQAIILAKFAQEQICLDNTRGTGMQACLDSSMIVINLHANGRDNPAT